MNSNKYFGMEMKVEYGRTLLFGDLECNLENICSVVDIIYKI